MKYRKKPVVIEAFQMTAENFEDRESWPAWLQYAWRKPQGTLGAVWPSTPGRSDGQLLVGSKEGPVILQRGNWLCRGVAGELYSCEEDVFAVTYEPVSDD